VHPTAAQRVRIVDYDPRWLDELVALWRASFEAALNIVDPHPIDEQRRYFVEQVEPANRVRVAMVDGGLAGFIAASRESIAQLYVHTARQRGGIGSQLVAWALAPSGGSLSLYTFAKNAVARRFYEKHGFVAVAFGFEPTWQLDDVRYRWSADGGDVA
jgi:ribosomal protein S18 acetylase RimI-like enzyme